mmetsp:Transcript_30349/g.59653  ORF Transcript_30349/g.59653 Transcript_30349/m.59653 type:complete len:124 (+) Transcript_30349:14-385(+)
MYPRNATVTVARTVADSPQCHTNSCKDECKQPAIPLAIHLDGKSDEKIIDRQRQRVNQPIRMVHEHSQVIANKLHPFRVIMCFPLSSCRRTQVHANEGEHANTQACLCLPVCQFLTAKDHPHA